MKKTVIFLAMLLFGAPLFADNSAVQELRAFAQLSARCHASAQATDDQASFDIFKKINSFTFDHRKEFKNIETLDEHSAKDLAKKCSALLACTMPPTTRYTQTEQLPLSSAINLFTRSTPNLLTTRTTSAFFSRLIWFTLIETLSFLAENNLTPDSEKKRKHLPEINERFKALGDVDFFSSYYGKLIGLNVAKALSIGMVNEYTPRGISSYIHRLAETIVPKLAAVIVAGFIEYNQEKLNTSSQKINFARASLIKITSPFIIGRGFLNRSHPLYKPMLMLSYIFPFFAGTSGELLMKEGSSMKAWANIAMDGISSFLIFNMVPQAVNKALPKKDMRLNPAHRRKAVCNSVRGICSQTFLLWNKKAFTA